MKQELKILSDEEFHLLEKAKQEGKIDEFIIEEAELFRDNVYCQQNFHIESLLKAVRKEKTVSIFMYKNDKVRQASFSLPEAATKEDFERELSDAIETAVFNENPTFSLPKKGDEASDESHIPREFFLNTKEEGFEGRRINLKVQEWIQIMKKKIEEAEDEELSLKLNYVEVFNKLVKHRLRTSTQLDKVDSKCSGYLEFVVTAIDKKTKKETEHIVYEHLSDIDTFAFEPYFEEQLQFAKDSARAKAAKTFSGKILLLNHAVSDFFVPDLRPNPFIGHASARMKYEKISKYELGQEIISAKADKVTIYANPLLKGNAASTLYDDTGVSARRLLIVENNILKNFLASKQFADYLEVKPSGPMGTLEVERGKNNIKDLEKNECYSIVSFSSFVPDNISGDFSAEIRLGYYIRDGVKTPFKGGLFTGNIFKILESVHLSAESQEIPGYLGPKAILFDEGQIVGDDEE